MRLFFLLIFSLAMFWPAPGTDTLYAASAERFRVSQAGYGGGGRFTTIAVDPHNPRIVLVGSDVSGIFRSVDGGKHFQQKGKALEGPSIADIAFHPVYPGRVYSLANYGLYESRDSGDTWKKLSDAVQYPARFFGHDLMVFSRHSLWVATDKNGVFQIPLNRSNNDEVLPVPGLESMKVNGLAIYQRRLYAATNKGIFRYEGGRWSAFNHGLAPYQMEIMDIGARADKRLYMVEKKSGLWAWDTGGGQWKSRSLDMIKRLKHRNLAYKVLALHPQNPDILILGTHPKSWPHHIFLSQDGGRSFDDIKAFKIDPAAADYYAVPPELSAIEDIAFAPQAPSQVYLADWWAVWKSSDGGRHWRQLHLGLQNTDVSDIKSHPQNPRHWYISVWDNGLMVSKDGGRHWQRKMEGVLPGHARELEFSAQNPDKMYLLMNPWFKTDKFYVYKSLDGGETWRDVSCPVPLNTPPSLGYISLEATNLEIDPFADNTLYVGTNGWGVFKSTDGGESWQAVNKGLATPYLQGPGALRVHPRNSQVLYASTLAGGVYKSVNGAATWQALNPDQPFSFGFDIDPSNPSRLVAGLPDKRVMLSRDGGKTWQIVLLPGKRPPHIAVYAVAFDPRRPEYVFAGTQAYDNKASDGLFMSTDGGRSFAPLPLGLPRVNIHDIYIPPDKALKILVGFSGSGLYQIDPAEQN